MNRCCSFDLYDFNSCTHMYWLCDVFKAQNRLILFLCSSLFFQLWDFFFSLSLKPNSMLNETKLFSPQSIFCMNKTHLFRMMENSREEKKNNGWLNNNTFVEDRYGFDSKVKCCSRLDVRWLSLAFSTHMVSRSSSVRTDPFSTNVRSSAHFLFEHIN